MKKIISLILLSAVLISSLWGCDLLSDNSITDINIDKSDADLILHFIDVGQGDCTLVESNGHFALIDAGEYSERDKVISYLSGAGVKELDYIIATHPHSDHVGSLAEVIYNFDTSALICTNAPTTSSWEYVMDAADERGVPYEIPSPYEVYQLGSATITILAPSEDAVYSNLNDYSIVTMIEYGNTSALLTGDAEKTVEKELVRGSYNLSADILKCGHHGSSSSSCSEFLDAVSPDAAIISCGKNNDYGHPHKETISALKYRNIPTWRTDLSGTVIAVSDGEQISITTASENTDVTKNTSTDITYIGNKNSKVFHSPYCDSVSKMSEKNKIEFSTYQAAIDSGYNPCGSCNP